MYASVGVCMCVCVGVFVCMNVYLYISPSLSWKYVTTFHSLFTSFFLVVFIRRGGGGGGSRHVQELKADYEEAEYSSSVQEKADVDAILEKPWTFNKSAAEASR